MTNDELKKKIVKVLEETEYEWTEDKGGYISQIFYDNLADALIAAGIGDIKRHRVFVSKDGKEVKQFYSGEEVENIVKERNELKVELRDKVDYIHEQDEVIKEYKHRAEVAENELKLYKLAVKIWQERYSDIRCFNFNIALRQAEKELAEE